MPNHMQKIKLISKFILIIFIPKSILTGCFESLRAILTTPTWNDWINLLLRLIPYHMRKTNFIIQSIPEIKLTNYLSSLWASPGMPDDTHMRQPTNICYFHGPPVRSKNSASYLNLLVRYFSLKNPAFWLTLKFLDHNSRIRFYPKHVVFAKN